MLLPVMKEEKNPYQGQHVISSALLSLPFSQTLHRYRVQAIVMATIGDAWAVLVGKRWGKLKWFEGKTLEGSLACLAGALLGSFIYGLMVPEAQIPWLILLWGGLVTLFTEGIFRFELDNLLVAPVSAAIMTAVIWIAYFF